VSYEKEFPKDAPMKPPKGVFKEAERSGLQEKHRINIKNKLGGASTSFNQGGEL
jgi:hypothetical protein